MESIQFQSKKYPLRFVKIAFDGETSVEPVSTLSLEEKYAEVNYFAPRSIVTFDFMEE